MSDRVSLDCPRSLGLEVRACGKDDKSRSNQPRDHENCALLCACAGESECHCEQHTREHMSRCPNVCRQDICRIKLSRRHLEEARYQRHKAADDGRKARKKDACHAVSGYKSFTSGNELRIPIQRPGSQNLQAISPACPEPPSCSNNRSRSRSNKKDPRVHISARR